MIADIRTHDLTVAYGDTVAIDRLSLDLPAGKIYGLLGRNGSGKTSLLSVLASYRKASSGSLTIGGVDPFENADVMRQTAFIRDTLDVNTTERIRSVLNFADGVRPVLRPGVRGQAARHLRARPRQAGLGRCPAARNPASAPSSASPPGRH